ncbi:MAG TPA: ABC transporter, partial [Polaromonas sp.]
MRFRASNGALCREPGLSYVFISHDLNTVRAVCDDIVVLYAGNKVESVPRAAFSQAARHPYFELLASSVPELRQGWLDQRSTSRLALPPMAVGTPPNPELCSFL